MGVVGRVALGLILPPSIIGKAVVLGAVGAATGKARELNTAGGLIWSSRTRSSPGVFCLLALVSDLGAVEIRKALAKADAIVEKAIDKVEADEIKVRRTTPSQGR